ncbi:MAG: formylglycine-generating enzyme family protein, partial [Planctomycetota bacterium]
MKELIGRADLLRTIAAGDLDHGEIAALFGFDHQPRSDRKKSATACGEQSSAPLVVSHESMEEAPHQPMTTGFQPAPIRFWRAQEFMRRSGSERHEEVDEPLLERIAPSASAESSNDQDSSDVRRVPFRPVTSIVDLLTRLRSLTEMTRPGTRPDVAKLISGICRGKTLQEVPREIRRSWGRGLHLIADTSPRLQPYRMDQGVASLVMRDLLPKSHATLATVSGCNLRPFTDWPQESIGRWEPEPGSTVLVLGDLGVLDRRQSGTVDSWVAFGERLRRRQLRMVALVPCHPSRIPDRLQRVWDVLPWDRSTLQVAPLTDEGAAEVIERLFTLLSFAVKVEPHLLRRVRLALPESSSHPELESLIWQHDDLESASSQWITFKRSLRTRLQALRSRESPALLRRVCQMVKAEHSDVYVGIRFSEVINLGDEAKTHFTEDEIAEATEWFEAILAEGEETVELSGSRAAFFRVVATHLGKRVREVLPGLDRIWAHCFEKHQSASPYPEADPAGFDQGLGQVRRIGIVQSRNQLRFQPETGKVETGDSPLAQITSIGDWLRWSDSRDDEELGFQIHRDFWAEGVAPEWASDWGVDEFGLWVELNLPSRDAGAEVPTVTQRLRWIAPGQFLMGSPEDEPGRYDDEGPQHEVTITRGFWMFDTPCTQAFYGAVTGDSPSEFKTPNRPVETVSWEDTQQFFEKLRAVYSAIEIGLPTEAEWEYACRGGTTDALYNGPIELKGINNATALDPIAWYGGNCGVEFDLEDGVNASWGEKQYEFEQGGTRNVGEKGPNPWG